MIELDKTKFSTKENKSIFAVLQKEDCIVKVIIDENGYYIFFENVTFTYGCNTQKLAIAKIKTLQKEGFKNKIKE